MALAPAVVSAVLASAAAFRLAVEAEEPVPAIAPTEWIYRPDLVAAEESVHRASSVAADSGSSAVAAEESQEAVAAQAVESADSLEARARPAAAEPVDSAEDNKSEAAAADSQGDSEGAVADSVADCIAAAMSVAVMADSDMTAEVEDRLELRDLTADNSAEVDSSEVDSLVADSSVEGGSEADNKVELVEPVADNSAVEAIAADSKSAAERPGDPVQVD